MGQGIYMRFDTSKDFISKMLGSETSQSQPYNPIPCDEFFSAYSTDIAASIEWWKPQNINNPACYYAETRRYLLIDRENGIVYFYSFPDFVGRSAKQTLFVWL